MSTVVFGNLNPVAVTSHPASVTLDGFGGGVEKQPRNELILQPVALLSIDRADKGIGPLARQKTEGGVLRENWGDLDCMLLCGKQYLPWMASF